MPLTFKAHSDVARPDWLGEKWSDTSWGNDTCPKASIFLGNGESLDDIAAECWVNYPAQEDREVSPLYMVCFLPTFADDNGKSFELYSGDDEAEARKYVRAVEIARTICLEIEEYDFRAPTFSELHNVCDANVLGEQEAFLASCGFTGTDDVTDAAAHAKADEVLNIAQDIVDHWLKFRAACEDSKVPATMKTEAEVRQRLAQVRARLDLQKSRPPSDSRSIAVLLIEGVVGELEWVLCEGK